MRSKVRILSIDGGGIRGVIPAQVLVYMEKRMQEAKGPDARLADYLDMIVGTSTGAILAALLLVPDENGRPKYTAQDALDFYVKHGESIFNKSIRRKSMFTRLFKASKFSADNLEKLFEEKLGDLKLSELLKPCIITSYNLTHRASLFFNSREPNLSAGDFYVRDVLRSTSAAPTYFDPAKIYPIGGSKDDKMMNVDGGVFANNPSMCAYAEGRKTHFENWRDKDDPDKAFPTAKNMLLLSLGTGGGRPELGFTSDSPKWGMLDWAKKTPEIMMDGGLDMVNHQVALLFASLATEEERKNFKRVDYPKLADDQKPPYDTDMSNADRKNIQSLLESGITTIEAANQERDDCHTLDKYVDLLLADG
jgi:patatin-like phospholipase/acyl hydrolase